MSEKKKKTIYKSAVASMQCPIANSSGAQINAVEEKNVFLRDKLLEAWGNIHFWVKETQKTKA